MQLHDDNNSFQSNVSPLGAPYDNAVPEPTLSNAVDAAALNKKENQPAKHETKRIPMEKQNSPFTVVGDYSDSDVEIKNVRNFY